ncbi:hypothetical protein ACIA5E_26135 [Nocardia asteroides]
MLKPGPGRPEPQPEPNQQPGVSHELELAAKVSLGPPLAPQQGPDPEL